jgi:hypothetical protein
MCHNPAHNRTCVLLDKALTTVNTKSQYTCFEVMFPNAGLNNFSPSHIATIILLAALTLAMLVRPKAIFHPLYDKYTVLKVFKVLVLVFYHIELATYVVTLYGGPPWRWLEWKWAADCNKLRGDVVWEAFWILLNKPILNFVRDIIRALLDSK